MRKIFWKLDCGTTLSSEESKNSDKNVSQKAVQAFSFCESELWLHSSHKLLYEFLNSLHISCLCHRCWWQTICCNQPMGLSMCLSLPSLDSVPKLADEWHVFCHANATQLLMQCRLPVFVFINELTSSFVWKHIRKCLNVYYYLSSTVCVYCVCAACRRNETLMVSTWATMRRFIDSLSLASRQDLNIIKLDLYSLCIKYKQFYLIICVRLCVW